MLDFGSLDYRKIKLESKRLILKEINLDYRKSFFEIFSNREVLRFTDHAIIQSLDEAIVFLMDCRLRATNKQHIFLGIFQKTDNQLLGIMSLYHLDLKHAFASLGILLAKESWRKGFMSEALLRFLEFCFIDLNFNRIEAQTFIDNIPAVKFFEKLRFYNEGKLRKNFLIEGKFEDSYLFSILKSEFIKFYES